MVERGEGITDDKVLEYYIGRKIIAIAKDVAQSAQVNVVIDANPRPDEFAQRFSTAEDRGLAGIAKNEKPVTIARYALTHIPPEEMGEVVGAINDRLHTVFTDNFHCDGIVVAGEGENRTTICGAGIRQGSHYSNAFNFHVTGKPAILLGEIAEKDPQGLAAARDALRTDPTIAK